MLEQTLINIRENKLEQNECRTKGINIRTKLYLIYSMSELTESMSVQTDLMSERKRIYV